MIARDVVMSVIIPTYNEESTVGALLDCLSLQTSRCFEIIIVDNGSTDATLDIVEDFCLTSEIPILLIAEEKPGPGNARKRGMDAVVSRLELTPEKLSNPYYLITTDSDARPHVDWVESFLRYQKQDFIGLLSGAHSASKEIDTRIQGIYGVTDYFLSIAKEHIKQSYQHPWSMKLCGPNCAFEIEAYCAAGGMTQPLNKDGSCGIKEIQELATKCYILGYQANQTGYIIETSRRRNFYELVYDVQSAYTVDPSDTRRFLTVRDSEKSLLKMGLMLPYHRWEQYHDSVMQKINTNY
ncbi:MAG: glycosyltransferase family A protein [Candidatus Saccharimonadales bacterium]